MKILHSKFFKFVFVGLFFGFLLCGVLGLFFLKFLVHSFDRATSSANISSDQESFFTSTGGSDYRRMALLAPYQAVSIDGNTWSIKLLTDSIRYQPSVNDIIEIAVIDQNIITHSSHTIYAGNEVSELWFVIMPATHIEKGFTSKDAMLNYLHMDENTFVSYVFPINMVYEKLLQQGYLEWFPEKYKKPQVMLTP